ncbi:DUF4150 domain-containing protein [uncultured Thiodictyon sp.]|uniref:DUF4150 domain-containing protein n=1 Tax=uncultured Thiodictyon sp. TaxID=1846217 RepID=UPI0025E25434|nr:DUF4150 domain-containing protein [uncultured Thiodictyon sp.]
MFALTMGAGMNLGFPDVCITPVGPIPVPIPYPNMQMSATSAPAAYTILMDCTPALNQSSAGLVSVGDEPGVLLGVVSHLESGEAEYIVGCITIITDGMPQQRLTSVTGQNAVAVLPNAPGICTVPSQVTVLTLG